MLTKHGQFGLDTWKQTTGPTRLFSMDNVTDQMQEVSPANVQSCPSISLSLQSAP